MKKSTTLFTLLIVLVILVVTTIVVVNVVINYLEEKTIESVVIDFFRFVKQRNTEKLFDIAGGKIFTKIFVGENISYEFLDTLSSSIPNDYEFITFGVIRINNMSPEERVDYGFNSRRVDIAIISKSAKVVIGYRIYVSKFSTTLEGKTVDLFKVIDMKKVGEIVF